ncbi:MAG: DNA-binding protein [Rhodocyclales bacterium]|nr:MAG: DNA-binding protein [Rhodocyclales bacterium]
MDSASAAEQSALASFSAVTLDLYEAARFLRMHPVTLRNKARAGEVPGSKPAKCWVFLRIDLEGYIRSKYPARALQGDTEEQASCHSTSVRTRQIGGSKSPSIDEQYRKALGLPIGPRLRNTMTD